MNTTKLTVKRTFIDWVLELFGAAMIILTFITIISRYSSLPDSIPIHFGFMGKPDSYGGKEMIWVMPILFTAIYIGLTYLERIPHLYNYPVEVTESNKQMQFLISTRMLRLLKVQIVGFLFFGKWSMMATAMGEREGLYPLLTPIFIGGLTLTVILGLILMFRNQ